MNARRATTVTVNMGLTLSLAALVAGCAANEVGQVGRNPREVITYAATASYPGGARESEDVRAVALNYPGREEIEIHNLTDRSIPAEAVWVNGRYVREVVGDIAPRGQVTVRYGNLVEAGPGTRDLDTLNRPVERVELQTPGGLFSVFGPVNK